MHDIRAIRADPDAFDFALRRRGLARPGVDTDASVLERADDERKDYLQRTELLQAERNRLAAEIGHRKKHGGAPGYDQVRAHEIKDEIEKLHQYASNTTKALDDLLVGLPNLPASDVPDGPDESANVVVHVRCTLADIDTPIEHDALAARLGYDPDAAAAIAGARFSVLKGPIARLHRALGQFMLDLHTGSHGYTEVAPPLLVREAAMLGTGQLPKFAEDSFQTTDGRWLIPTAEVSLTNLVRENILPDVDLPLRFVALTPCFRQEAGSAGRDTRGLIRQHQFDKVELVSITRPADSEAEHERMTAAAEAVLDALGLPYRRMLLCAGDMGFSARKTFDLEVWLPGQGRYREISSCSNCGDFQARRMNARFRLPGGKPEFVHTLNGSGVAVGRALVAVIENYQRADGSVEVPAALLAYMGGIAELVPG